MRIRALIKAHKKSVETIRGSVCFGLVFSHAAKGRILGTQLIQFSELVFFFFFLKKSTLSRGNQYRDKISRLGVMLHHIRAQDQDSLADPGQAPPTEAGPALTSESGDRRPSGVLEQPQSGAAMGGASPWPGPRVLSALSPLLGRGSPRLHRVYCGWPQYCPCLPWASRSRAWSGPFFPRRNQIHSALS